ncbi:TonB-dependent receptor [Microbulbifer litoralis]|uniref:TonB-dependent receptor n=1 Tax=Microbulbifer litoralis TaxID=2933965 RepID=UPI0020288541|nr:TonB-dependent receptor plug domain-containing protein [Microbulbifer sp. GX H0434]
MNSKIKPLALAIGLAPVAASAATIEEVTVTAQKRAESVQDVPISISAYSGDFMEESGVDTLSDLAPFTPNFTISSSSQESNVRISIRGVGSAGNSAIEPSVGVFIDGIYYPRPGAVIGNLMDIQTVEVLRGPQGTLFGRNTPVGALNITTRDATDEFEADITAGAGNYGAWNVGGTASGSLTDGVRFRLSGKTTSRDSYITNDYVGNEDVGVRNGDPEGREDTNLRGKLSFDVGTSMTLDVIADYAAVDSGGATVELQTDSATPLFNGTSQALFGDTPVTEDSFDHRINQPHEDSLRDRQSGLAVKADYEMASLPGTRCAPSPPYAPGKRKCMKMPCVCPQNSCRV